jgi:hypothetical protein
MVRVNRFAKGIRPVYYDRVCADSRRRPVNCTGDVDDLGYGNRDWITWVVTGRKLQLDV